MLSLAFAENASVFQCEYNPVYTSQRQIINKQNTLWLKHQELYISPYSLNKALLTNSPNYFLVDIRNKTNFSKYHILGSFNLPKEQLLTKSFFKSRKIILVGTVFDNRYLEELNKKLKNKGFNDVQILDGGIDYWRSQIDSKQSSLLFGNINSLDKLLKNDISQWIIINTTEYTQINKNFPNVLLTGKNALLQPEIYKESFKASNGTVINILIVIDEKEQMQQVLSIWKESIKANIFVIHTPKMLRGLNEFLSNQKLVRMKKRADGAKMTCL